MINVQYSGCQQQEYVNPKEVEKGLELIARLNRDRNISSILVITPVRLSSTH